MHAAHHAVLRLFNLRFFLQPMSHSFNLFHAPQREVRKYLALDNTLAQQNTRAWIAHLAVNSCPCRQPIAKQQQNQCPIHEADFCKRQRMAGSMMIHKCSKSDKHCPSFFIILRVCFYFEKHWSGKSGKSINLISLTKTCQPQGVDVSVGMPLRWDPFGRDGVRRQEVKGEWYADRADDVVFAVWFDGWSLICEQFQIVSLTSVLKSSCARQARTRIVLWKFILGNGKQLLQCGGWISACFLRVLKVFAIRQFLNI